MLKRAEAFIIAFKGDALITPAVAPHALYTLDGPTLKAARDLSRRYGVPTLIHLAETQDEVKTAQERLFPSPVAYLESLAAACNNLTHMLLVRDLRKLTGEE